MKLLKFSGWFQCAVRAEHHSSYWMSTSSSLPYHPCISSKPVFQLAKLFWYSTDSRSSKTTLPKCPSRLLKVTQKLQSKISALPPSQLHLQRLPSHAACTSTRLNTVQFHKGPQTTTLLWSTMFPLLGRPFSASQILWALQTGYTAVPQYLWRQMAPGPPPPPHGYQNLWCSSPLIKWHRICI